MKYEIRLSKRADRIYRCHRCGLAVDLDLNAALQPGSPFCITIEHGLYHKLIVSQIELVDKLAAKSKISPSALLTQIFLFGLHDYAELYLVTSSLLVEASALQASVRP